jgi:mRNA-degrading endonuclease RelE of RelBE toxin-antitoxin system
MNSRTTRRFRKAFERLPQQVQKQAKEAYLLFEKNPYHPSLYFKRVHSTQPIYSVRITLNYRSVGVLEGDTIIWFWIGSHEDYDKLLAQI